MLELKIMHTFAPDLKKSDIYGSVAQLDRATDF